MATISEFVTVDNISLSDLGVVLGKDSFKSLLQWSALKSVKTNDWAEYDGIEADLSNPTLDKRNVTLNFHAQGIDGYERFLQYLTRHSESYWTFYDLGVALALRVDANSLQHVSKKWQSFSVTFVDDLPYHPVRAVTDSTALGGGGFIIDDYPFDFFGVHILDGTLEKLRQVGKVKERLTVAENSRDGAVYDTGGAVMTASNEISIKCLIRAVNMETCVNNYYALLNYIKRPNLRRIVVKSTLEILDCYYKSATCENVHLKLASGAAGIAFTIVFTVVGKGLLKIIGNDGANEYLTDEQGVFLAP